MSTTVVRVPERIKKEVETASRVTGRSTSELYEEAWNHYKQTPDFEVELREAQKALAAGDIEKVTDLVLRQAARSQALRAREG